MTKRLISNFAAMLVLLLALAACGGDSGGSSGAASTGGGTAANTNPCTNGSVKASEADQLCRSTPQGRVYVAAQLADRLSVIDVATNQMYTSIGTGRQPHHAAVNPANTEVWVSLYGETYAQVFSLADHHEIAKVELADRSDDLTFTPDGKLVFFSLGASQMQVTPNGNIDAPTSTSAIAVVDATTYKLIKKIPVGNTPHGIKVRPDGKEVYVTNTISNDVSVVDVAKLEVIATIANVGANPFEVSFSNDGSKAYVSNFQGGSIAVLDTASHTRAAIWKTGQRPAMIWVSADDKTIYVAATGDGKLLVQDTTDKGKISHRVVVGRETHGVVSSGSKLFITNIADNTVNVVDPQSYEVVGTIAVGNAPNGLVYTPYKGPSNLARQKAP